MPENAAQAPLPSAELTDEELDTFEERFTLLASWALDGDAKRGAEEALTVVAALRSTRERLAAAEEALAYIAKRTHEGDYVQRWHHVCDIAAAALAHPEPEGE